MGRGGRLGGTLGEGDSLLLMENLFSTTHSTWAEEGRGNGKRREDSRVSSKFRISASLPLTLRFVAHFSNRFPFASPHLGSDPSFPSFPSLSHSSFLQPFLQRKTGSVRLSITLLSSKPPPSSGTHPPSLSLSLPADTRDLQTPLLNLLSLLPRSASPSPSPPNTHLLPPLPSLFPSKKCTSLHPLVSPPTLLPLVSVLPPLQAATTTSLPITTDLPRATSAGDATWEGSISSGIVPF